MLILLNVKYEINTDFYTKYFFFFEILIELYKDSFFKHF